MQFLGTTRDYICTFNTIFKIKSKILSVCLPFIYNTVNFVILIHTLLYIYWIKGSTAQSFKICATVFEFKDLKFRRLVDKKNCRNYILFRLKMDSHNHWISFSNSRFIKSCHTFIVKKHLTKFWLCFEKFLWTNHVTYGFAIYKRVSEWGIAERLADETWIPLVRFKSAALFFQNQTTRTKKKLFLRKSMFALLKWSLSKILSALSRIAELKWISRHGSP